MSKAKDEGRRSRPNNPGGETEKKINEVKEKPATMTEKAVYASTGAMQGLSFGFSDEIEGAMGGLGYGIASLNPKWNKTGETFKEAVKRGYIKKRDESRNLLEEGYKKAPIVTGTAEVVGAIANPIKFTKVSKTAPLRVKAKANLLDATTSAGLYGIGSTNKNQVSEYAKNIGSSTVGNIFGYGASNRLLGRAGSPIARKIIGEGTNQGTTKIFNLFRDKD